jgi:hypothetical protein
VAHGLLVGQRVKVGLEVGGAEAVVLRQPLRELARLLTRHIKLGAVTRGQDRRLARQAALQLAERLLHALDMEHHALANRERRGLVIQSEGKQGCGQAADYKRVSSFSAGTGGLNR